jgi:hypothetical protein
MGSMVSHSPAFEFDGLSLVFWFRMPLLLVPTFLKIFTPVDLTVATNVFPVTRLEGSPTDCERWHGGQGFLGRGAT